MRADDAWCAVLELAASQHGAFHRRQAAELGMTSPRLRRAVDAGVLNRHGPHVFLLRSSADVWHRRLMASTLHGGVASHRSAAALHRLEGFEPGPVEVCVTRGEDRRHTAATVHQWRRTRPNDITVVDGIPCTSLARTLAQLGSVVGIDQVEQALDCALRRGFRPRWIEETITHLLRPGLTGVGVLRDVIEDPARSGNLPDSWFERVVELSFRSSTLPKPVLQHKISTPTGVRRFDLAFPTVRLAVEAHSRQFHFSPRQVEADNERDLEVAALGWEVLYVTWGLAHEPERLIRVVEQIYQSRL